MDHFLTKTSLRNYEQLIVMLHKMGVEVGDNQHSDHYPAAVRDAEYSIIMDTLKESMTSTEHGFVLPFCLTMDKDKSKGRQVNSVTYQLERLIISRAVNRASCSLLKFAQMSSPLAN